MTESIVSEDLAEVLRDVQTQLASDLESERQERARHQRDASHYRSEARRLDAELTRVGDALRAQHAKATQAAADSPGRAAAARVRQARAALDMFEQITRRTA